MSKTEETKDSSTQNNETDQPSHIMVGKYATLMETNGKECESWYYFIRVEGNEDALKHLQDQLTKVEWYIVEDLSTFDLDLDHYVDAKTAKEMTKVELNSCSFHRKFDGKLEMIDFNFKKKDLRDNERMICKVFDLLGYGQIEDYISDEDLDDEDLVSDNSSDDESSDDDSSDDESSSDDSSSDDDSSSASSVEDTNTKKVIKDLPPLLSDNKKKKK